MGAIKKVNLKALFNLVLGLSFIFGSLTAQAELSHDDLVRLHYELNYFNTAQDFGNGLKTMFKSKEDQRLIDKDVKQFEKVAKKWDWRFEVKRSGKINFRVNGKVQVSLKVINPQKKVFELFGEKIVVSDSMKYIQFREVVGKVFSKNYASNDSLFIRKANAIAVGWLMALFALGTTAGGVAHTNSTNDINYCMWDPPIKHSRSNKRLAKYGNLNHLDDPNFNGTNANFGHNGSGGNHCRFKSKIPNQTHRRIGMVARNFRSNGKFRTGKASKPCLELKDRDPRGYSGVAGKLARKGRFDAPFCECVVRKMNSICSIGWNLSFEGAYKTCSAGYETYKFCGTLNSRAPVVATGSGEDPLTPCTKDKHGNYAPGCAGGGTGGGKPTTGCQYDANGVPGPGCPGYGDDFLTPGGTGKSVGNAESGTPSTTYTPVAPSTDIQPVPSRVGPD